MTITTKEHPMNETEKAERAEPDDDMTPEKARTHYYGLGRQDARCGVARRAPDCIRDEDRKQHWYDGYDSIKAYPVSDSVHHPAHYTSLGATCTCGKPIECIQVAEHMGFRIGNATKYLWRVGHKGKPIEDLKKAMWYIQREIDAIENENNTAKKGNQ